MVRVPITKHSSNITMFNTADTKTHKQLDNLINTNTYLDDNENIIFLKEISNF